MRTRSISVVVLLLVMSQFRMGGGFGYPPEFAGFPAATAQEGDDCRELLEFAVKKAAERRDGLHGQGDRALHQDDVKQDVWIADFSPVNAKGKFYLDVPGRGPLDRV